MPSFSTEDLITWIDRLVDSTREGEEEVQGATAAEEAQPSEPESCNPDCRSKDENETTDTASVASFPDSLLLSIARPAMACEFEVLLNQHQYSDATDRALEALDLIDEQERVLSVYKNNSELSNLNRFGAKRAVGLSRGTLELLALAQSAHWWTDGAFDVTAGALSEAWGFSRRDGKKPNQEAIDKALSSVGSQFIRLDEESSSATLEHPEARVNPGGIGKGYALDQAANHLWHYGIEDFMIHGGLSSVTARGNRHSANSDGGWKVSLKHPWRWEEHLGSIRLINGALGTSGSGKQFFHFGGKRYSHIIDPRTGWPAQGMMSVTVLCPSAAISDILATALFVLGVEASREFLEQNTAIGAILMYQQEKSGRQEIETHNLEPDAWQAR